MARKKIVEKIRGGKVSTFNETTAAGDIVSTSHEGTAPVSLHDAPPNSIKHRNPFHSFSSYYLPDDPPIERGVPILYPLLVRLNV